MEKKSEKKKESKNRKQQSKKRNIKTAWLEAPPPLVDPATFLAGFAGHPPPIDTNQDGHVDHKELMVAMVAAGSSDEKMNKIIIDSFFDVLDPENTGKVRTDVFGRTWRRMGQYNAIAYIKELVYQGEIYMVTQTDGSKDCFFTKDEIQQAFAIQLGPAIARREVDACFRLLDQNNSSFMCSRELKEWYWSEANADLRRISMRRRIRKVEGMAFCYAKQGLVLMQIERHVRELEDFMASLKTRREKRRAKKKGSDTNMELNRLVSRLAGVLDFLKNIRIRGNDTDARSILDSVVLDSIMVPIRAAYKMGATDPDAPPPPKEEEEDD